jgi:hypothetical protein
MPSFEPIVPPEGLPEKVAEKSILRSARADHAPVRTDCSRRTLLQAGSVMGLAALSGCANQKQVADGPMPGPAWPDPIAKPPTPAPPTKSTPQVASTPPVFQPPQVTPPGPQQPGLPSGVLPRTKWTTAGLVRPGNVRPMNGVTYITIHHDGMPFTFNGEAESDSIKRLRSIQGAHTQRVSKAGEKWADIGYHYVIDRAGRVWEGRPIQYQGAHVQDCNEHNIGVMCLGNFMLQYPTKAQTDRLDQFVAQLMRDNRISLRNVRTHQEWNPTECPGRNLQVYMARTRSRGGGMALAVAATDPQLVA